jgi:hypothetical protein
MYSLQVMMIKAKNGHLSIYSFYCFPLEKTANASIVQQNSCFDQLPDTSMATSSNTSVQSSVSVEEELAKAGIFYDSLKPIGTGRFSIVYEGKAYRRSQQVIICNQMCTMISLLLSKLNICDPD